MIHALHGNFGLPSDWDAALPPGIPAKSWHLWETHRSRPETRTLTGFAAWFNRQIAALPPDPSRILAGYSLGGRLALHVLLDRPDLWHAALLISTHPGLAEADERAARLAQDLAWQERCRTAPWEEVCAAWNRQPVLQDSSPAASPGLTEPWRQEIAAACSGWSLGHQPDLLPALTENTVPLTWMAGSQDLKFLHLAAAAAPRCRSASFLPVENAGHRLLREAPVTVRNTLTAKAAG